MKVLVLCFLLLFLACNQPVNNLVTDPEPEPINNLLGSWELKEVHWKTKDTVYSIAPSQPGLLVISEDRYAVMWSPNRTARVPFANLSNPTPEEIASGFRSIVFNGGTYRVTDSTLTTTAMIAKVPGFEGGTQFYKYDMENETLRLTMFDETYPNGDKPAWFGTYETEFVYQQTNSR